MILNAAWQAGEHTAKSKTQLETQCLILKSGVSLSCGAEECPIATNRHSANACLLLVIFAFNMCWVSRLSNDRSGFRSSAEDDEVPWQSKSGRPHVKRYASAV